MTTPVASLTRMLGVAWLLGVGAAHALPDGCERAARPDDLDAELDAAEQVAFGKSRDATEQGWARLEEVKERLICLDEPVQRVLVGRLARLMATMAFNDQDELRTEQWWVSAELAAPGLAWPDRAPAGLVQARAPTVDMVGSGRALSGTVYSNGRRLHAALAPAETPHLVQIAGRSGEIIDAWWQDGAAFPEAVVTDESPDERAADARDACEGFGLPRLIQLAEQSRALHQGDVEAHDAAFEATLRLTPCLTQRMGAREWAVLLGNEGVVRFDREDPTWLGPFHTAATIDPDAAVLELREDIARLWRQERPGPASDGPVLPTSATFFVDGLEEHHLPDLDGVHVVQRRTDEGWETRVLLDQPFPPEWAGRSRERRERTGLPIVSLAGVASGGAVAAAGGAQMIATQRAAREWYPVLLDADRQTYWNEELKPRHTAGAALVALGTTGAATAVLWDLIRRKR